MNSEIQPVLTPCLHQAFGVIFNAVLYVERIGIYRAGIPPFLDLLRTPGPSHGGSQCGQR